MKLDTKRDFRKRRQLRLRKKIVGTNDRPRMSIYRSNKQFYIQFIDDENQRTLVSASTMNPGLKSGKGRVKVDEAGQLGKKAAEIAKSKGIEEVVFDRGGYRYAGKIKILADAAREGGLKF